MHNYIVAALKQPINVYNVSILYIIKVHTSSLSAGTELLLYVCSGQKPRDL